MNYLKSHMTVIDMLSQAGQERALEDYIQISVMHNREIYEQ